MNVELKKRIITSFFLLALLVTMFIYSFVLIAALIVIAVISWIEFYTMISKIFFKNNIKEKILRLFFKTTTLCYLSFLVSIILIIKLKNPELEIFIIYSISISIASDIGGLVIGKIFKGRKLTKISPNKTFYGSAGSLLFSLLLIPFFYQYFLSKNLLFLIMITLFISIISQIGDLFVSYIKRKAKVKNTSDLLPGHGGVLDRIDGIIFSIPVGFLLLNNFNI